MPFKISIERLVGGTGEVHERRGLEFRFDTEGAARVKADELVSPYLDRHYVHQGGFWGVQGPRWDPFSGCYRDRVTEAIEAIALIARPWWAASALELELFGRQRSACRDQAIIAVSRRGGRVRQPGCLKGAAARTCLRSTSAEQPGRAAASETRRLPPA